MKSENFYQEYRKIVIPLMFQGLVTTLVSMIDNLMVGQLGDNAIAAVSMGNKILGILMFTMFAMNSATSVYIAQYFGANNIDKQKQVFRIGLISTVSIFILFSLLYLIMPQTIVHFFVQDVDIQSMLLEYLSIMLLGYLPFTLSTNYSSTLKVIGQVRMPLIASLCGVGVNTLLNYMLIFGNFNFPSMGIKGAAIATVISRVVEFVIIFSFVYVNHFDFNTKLKDIFQFSRELLKDVIKKAVPLVINEIIWSLGQATILKAYGFRGGLVLAAMAIVDIVQSIFYSIVTGLSSAAAVLVSQRLGSGKLDEAYANAKEMLKIIVIMAFVLGGLMFISSYVIPNFYNVTQESRELAVSMIRLASVVFWIYLVNTQCYFIIRAGGDMKSVLIMDGLFTWGLTIPVLSYVSYYTTLPVVIIFIAVQVCDFAKMLVCLKMFFKKRWVKNLTIQEEKINV